MKLATAKTTTPGATELYGEAHGSWHNLTALIPSARDVGSVLENELLSEVASALAEIRSEGQPLEALELAPPVVRPRTILCVGRNYPEHVKEGQVPMPEFPILFAKFPNTLLGHNGTVPSHPIANSLDYEGELALVIGREASKVSAGEAWDYIAGYTILNDISDRDLQEGDLQWIRGKSLDGYCPIGPVFITADMVENVDELIIETRINGEIRQNEPCGEMAFSIPELMEFITEAITLQPGDIVATGTPSGTGIGFSPPNYLNDGDRMDVTIEPIGTLTNTVGSA